MGLAQMTRQHPNTPLGLCWTHCPPCIVASGSKTSHLKLMVTYPSPQSHASRKHPPPKPGNAEGALVIASALSSEICSGRKQEKSHH